MQRTDFYFLVWGMPVDDVEAAAAQFSRSSFICYVGEAPHRREEPAEACVLVEFLGPSDRRGFAAYLRRMVGYQGYHKLHDYPGIFTHLG